MIIEVSGALWMLWRYRAATASRLIAALLFCLGLFQLAEYMICERAVGLSSTQWAQVGFASISLLPALGMNLAMHIRGKINMYGLIGTYLIAIVFVVFFLFIGQGVRSSICGGNYILFRLMENTKYPYIAYYYGWMLCAMMYCLYYAHKLTDRKRAKTLQLFAAGYASFILPATTVTIIRPDLIYATPSIMCGFAVFLALILLFGIAPAVCQPRNLTHSG